MEVVTDMAKCEWCGVKFDSEEAKEVFESYSVLWKYSQIRPCLCGDCAVKAEDEEIEETLFVNCPKCGKEFDLYEAVHVFDLSHDDASTFDLGDYYCEDCAEEEYEKYINDETGRPDYLDEFDDDDEEMNDGCRTCGNPDYPACRPSCGVWVDDDED